MNDKKKKSYDNSVKRAEDILKLIRSRERGIRPDLFTKPIWQTGMGIWRHSRRKPIENRPMTADTWQKFKRDFISKYDGEEVKETGFTDSEFLEWFKTGKRELHNEPGKLQALLAELHAHENAAQGDDDDDEE